MFADTLRVRLDNRRRQLIQRHALKHEIAIDSPQGGRLSARAAPNEAARGYLNLCANNYLGLANDPRIVDAAREAISRFGLGMASVRFISGTHGLHWALEHRLASFMGTEACALFPSAFDANGALFEALLSDEDAVLSDALNHASIIDGIRLSRAARFRYAHGDVGARAFDQAAAADASARLRSMSAYLRRGLLEPGFEVLPGDHPIVPVVFGDSARAQSAASALAERGVLAQAFSYPVVPEGTARLRLRASLALADADLDRVIEAFRSMRS